MATLHLARLSVCPTGATPWEGKQVKEVGPALKELAPLLLPGSEPRLASVLLPLKWADVPLRRGAGGEGGGLGAPAGLPR